MTSIDEYDANATMPEDDPNGNTNAAPGPNRWGKSHAGAQELQKMYGEMKWKRRSEVFGISAAIITFIIQGTLLITGIHNDVWWHIFISLFIGALVADFISGLVHWAADTWGSVEGVIGKGFIRSFREHHVDPVAITRHDFIECNGDNFLVTVPFMVTALYLQFTGNEETIREWRPHLWFLFSLGIYVAMTNQIHKWSHTWTTLPKWVEFLQRAHIILPRWHHKKHHISPHACNYCITIGFMNYPLELIQFWTGLEFAITKITGNIPRSDDMKWAEKTIHSE
ncbi:hypothetical protein PRIPAC_84210 [Pristionchus pacificus]|uniref:TMEM189_B_dmain domain-containing protein n=1 Tax=Pristionchus pacificus TaxID=54126 RepID=A0A2A6CIU1_PRIPA|nr:hypothetical protein PRIPAC_84210 [Pristionchus pacificus]|eukprot:PDM77998.1 hypothetical protein PRIPAC_35187 [Pristionchus pacificus]